MTGRRSRSSSFGFARNLGFLQTLRTFHQPVGYREVFILREALRIVMSSYIDVSHTLVKTKYLILIQRQLYDDLYLQVRLRTRYATDLL